MEEAITDLWYSLDVRHDERIRIIMKEAYSQNWPIGQTMIIINQLRLGKPVKQEVKKLDTFAGCQTDNDGNVVDPYTLQEIPEEFLISYFLGDMRYCFDIRSLGKSLYEGENKNPLTRLPFPDEVLDKVRSYNEQIKRTIRVGNTAIDVLYDTVFDVLVKVLRTQGLLEALPRINPFHDNKSLYTLPLNSDFIVTANTIDLYPFKDTVEQAVSLKTLFEYCAKYRSGIHETLYQRTGFLLRVPPIFLDESGQQFLLDPAETIYETVKRIYIHLGGYHTIKDYNLVLEDGTPLFNFDLDNLVSEAIPSLEIRYIPYIDEEERDEVHANIHWHAFIHEDNQFIREIASHPEQTLLNSDFDSVLTDYNYTVDDVIEYFQRELDRRNSEALSIFHDRIPASQTILIKIVKGVVLYFVHDRDKLTYAVNGLSQIAVDVNSFITWRDIKEVSRNEEIVVAYLSAVLKKHADEDKIRTLLEGGKLQQASSVSTLRIIDDVEFFLRHYDGNLEVLVRFLSSSTRIGKYLLENESPLKLYQALILKRRMPIPRYAKRIINKLSIDDIRFLFKQQELIYIEQFALRLPQDILDNESYYTEVKNVGLFLYNPNFHKFKEALLALLKEDRYSDAIMAKLVTAIGSSGMIKLYQETGSLAILELILIWIRFEAIHGFHIVPSLQNFKFFLERPRRDQELFFRLSKMSKEDIVGLLCQKKPSDKTILGIIDYFQFKREDALQLLECNSGYTLILAIADLVLYEDIAPYLDDTNRKNWFQDYWMEERHKTIPNKNRIGILQGIYKR